MIKIKKSEHILEANQVTKDILEFMIDTASPYHKKNLKFIFYCATDWHSALVKLVNNNVQLLNTSHLIGSYDK